MSRWFTVGSQVLLTVRCCQYGTAKVRVSGTRLTRNVPGVSAVRQCNLRRQSRLDPCSLSDGRYPQAA